MIGLDSSVLVAPHELERVRDFNRRRNAGEPVPARYEFEGRRKDGAQIWLESHTSLIEWEGSRASQAVILDVTDRRRAEAERLHLSQAVDQAGDLILITDNQGVIQYANPAFERITGYSREEALGMTPRMLKSGVQDEAFYKNMWEAILKGETWVGQYVNQRKDGTLYHVDAVHSPIKNERGEVTHIFAVHHDITQRIDLEEQLRQSQKMEALGQLAGGVAHEFNNLLQVIKGYSELAMRGIPQDHAQLKNFTHIVKATEKAAQLTSHLLAFTRQQPLHLHQIDLNEVVEGLGTIVRPILGVDTTFRTELADNLPKVRVDMLMIEQVLVNLCINARDAMPDGGTLTLASSLLKAGTAAHARHTGLKDRDYVRLSVTDTGMGIPEEMQQNVFEPFFTTKDPGKGTGLGLSMAYGIMEQHKGVIEVESTPGQGATFHIIFPAMAPRPPHGAPSQGRASQEGAAISSNAGTGVSGIGESTPVEGHQSGERIILLAETNPALHGMLVEGLRQEGFRVVEVAEEEQFPVLFEANREQVSLAVVDEVLPRLDGERIYRTLRELDPTLPILLCINPAAHRDTPLPQDASLHVIPKPMTVERILGGVRKAVASA